MAIVQMSNLKNEIPEISIKLEKIIFFGKNIGGELSFSDFTKDAVTCLCCDFGKWQRS